MKGSRGFALFFLAVAASCTGSGAGLPKADSTGAVANVPPPIDYCGPKDLVLGTGWQWVAECKGVLPVGWENVTASDEVQKLWDHVKPDDNNPVWTINTAWSGVYKRRCKSSNMCGSNPNDLVGQVKVRAVDDVFLVHVDAIRDDFGYGGVVVGALQHFGGLEDAVYNVTPSKAGQTTLGYIMVLRPRKSTVHPAKWRLERFFQVGNVYKHEKASEGTFASCDIEVHSGKYASFTDPKCLAKDSVLSSIKKSGRAITQEAIDAEYQLLFRAAGSQSMPLGVRIPEVDHIFWEPCPWGCCPYLVAAS